MPWGSASGNSLTARGLFLPLALAGEPLKSGFGAASGAAGDRFRTHTPASLQKWPPMGGRLRGQCCLTLAPAHLATAARPDLAAELPLRSASPCPARAISKVFGESNTSSNNGPRRRDHLRRPARQARSVAGRLRQVRAVPDVHGVKLTITRLECDHDAEKWASERSLRLETSLLLRCRLA
jgi:hypothetical protein